MIFFFQFLRAASFDGLYKIASFASVRENACGTNAGVCIRYSLAEKVLMLRWRIKPGRDVSIRWWYGWLWKEWKLNGTLYWSHTHYSSILVLLLHPLREVKWGGRSSLWHCVNRMTYGVSNHCPFCSSLAKVQETCSSPCNNVDQIALHIISPRTFKGNDASHNNARSYLIWKIPGSVPLKPG